MNYYLFDTSALVLFYQKANKKLEEIFIQKAQGKAFVYLPQFCVAEVFNTFARLHFRDRDISNEIYKVYCESFKKDIANRNVIYCYDLHRYHNLNAHEIFEIEQTLPYDEEKPMSTFDILIIAMGMELMKMHPPQNVFLVTGDKRISKICRSSSKFPRSVSVYDRRDKTEI